MRGITRARFRFHRPFHKRIFRTRIAARVVCARIGPGPARIISTDNTSGQLSCPRRHARSGYIEN